MKAHRHKETLEYLYHDKKLSTYDIGEKLNCTAQTVWKWMQKKDIDTRKPTSEKAGWFGYIRGYAYFQTQEDGTLHNIRVHRLLAVAKYGYEEVKNKVVHHKNGVRWDNRYENIEIMDNSKHVKKHNEGAI
jgi:hypothetical protein